MMVFICISKPALLRFNVFYRSMRIPVKWFKPETLGDTIIDCFGDKTTNSDYETFYISKDSTEVYYDNFHN